MSFGSSCFSVMVLCAVQALASQPTILSQPLRQTVVVGSSYTFSVSATGTDPLTYQWRKNQADLAGKTNISLPLTAIQTNDAGNYSVVVNNSEGSVTSAPALLTVRLASDPVYPTPQGGWNYLFAGSSAASAQSASLDGTWVREPNSDSWDGLGRGVGVGLSGGVATTNGILTIEDSVASATGSGNNRRYYFTHNLTNDFAVTNASTLLNDGVTLTFRARLTPPTDPLIELTNAPNGLVNYSDGKGMFGLRQSGGSGMLLSFSLNTAIEDTSTSTSYNFGQAGLHMNNLNGDVRSAAVDPGEGGTLNLLPLDPTVFHEFWITIADNGAAAGTHRVSVYLDGSKTPTIFNLTAGTGSDGPATNYLALGLGSSLQRGGVDIDFFGYKAGVETPSGFNEPVGIALQPVTQFVAEGQAATYNVGVTGTPPYAFQWYRNGTAIPGATNATYQTPPVVPADESATFFVVVANDAGQQTSGPAGLHLLGAPMITAQPQSLLITNGDTASFTVTVASAVTPGYQWRYNGGNLAGRTNQTLLLPGASAVNAGSYDVVVSNNSGSVTSTVAVLTVNSFDYGDAPEPAFPTLKAHNGARHLITPGIYLGATIDADVDGQPNAGATGDDASGTDDEDGVIFTTPLLAGQAATVQVIASTNGFLNAWVDFNQNGSWSGAGEQVFTNALLATGTNTLQIIIPGGAAPGLVQSRFRFCTVAGSSFDGVAVDGEVEDYALTIVPVADLRIAQTAAPDPVAVGSNLTCSILISNAGPSTASSVVTTNTLAAGVNFVSAVSSQGSCIFFGGQVTCNLGVMNGGTSATMTLVLQPAAAGTVSNTVSVSSGELDPVPANNTAVAFVTALQAPAITGQPASLTITNGTPATFTITATGAPPLIYQWRRNGANLSGQTNTTLTISNTQPADAASYTVRVSNAAGAIDSQPAILLVLVPPAIATQPQSQTNLAGSTAVFTVTGTGSVPLGYQWSLNATTLAGATASTLTLAGVQSANAGSYRVVLSNAAGTVTSAVATLTVVAMDFGDAPDSYHTVLTNNGARHRIVAGIYLGAGVDFEPDGQPDPGATGDDLAGTDDEDGVFWTTPVRAGQSAGLAVVASTNGLLNAWIDFNRNGSWAEAGEQVFTNRSLVAGTNNLTFTVPSGANAGASFARFRFSTASGLAYDGEAPNGEVEDYAVNLEGVADLRLVRLTHISPIATGDEQTYSITVSNAGPSLATAASLTDRLPAGVIFVSGVGSQGTCNHSAGTVVCSLGDLAAGAAATVTLTAIPTAPGNATNTATVGANPVDLVPANNALTVISAVFDAPVIDALPQSQIVTNGGTATFNVAASGTALRYQWLFNGSDVNGATNPTLTLVNAQFINAGNYTVRVTNEVGNVVSSPATLTVLVPVSIFTDPQSQTILSGGAVTFSVVASGSPPITYQWEFEGVDLPGQTGASLALANVQTNQAGAYRVRVTNPIRAVTSAAANLTVWQKPVFTEQPQSSTNVAGGTVTLSAQAVGTAPLGYQWFFGLTNLLAAQTNTLLVLTNVQTARTGPYTAVASNIAGVSTSSVAVLTVYEMDFGDAPEASGYPVTLAFNGARHRVVPGIRLGALIDFETNGLPNATATGDDTPGAGNPAGVDDEDGVTFPTPLLVGQPASAVVVASTNGFLDAWIDFNGNGAWSDPEDQILSRRAVLPGTNVVTFSIPPSALAGNRFARFRFSTAGGLPYDGFAPDGEVEDYRVTILAAVDLAVGLVAVENPVAVSSNLFYLMSVTNRGPSTATSVMLTNVLPPSMTYVEATPSQGYCGDIGSTVFCPVGNIPSGGVVTMLLTVRPTLPGTFANTAFAGATETEVSPADNSVTLFASVVLPTVGFSNSVPIPVADATGGGPGKGNPYPSTIVVSGLTSAVYKVTVSLNNLSHPFAKDFNILLVGPQGQSVVLMSDAGGTSLSGVSLGFDDAAEGPLPGAGVIVAGTYQPSNYGGVVDAFPPPAPVGPYGSRLGVFTGTDPNGTWSLYVADGHPAGIGTVGGGWQLNISTADPIADLVLTAAGSPSPVAINSNLVFNLTVTNRGPAAAGGVWLTNILPAGSTFISATSTLGSCSQLGGVVSCNVGSLGVGAGAAAIVTVRPTVAALLTNTTRVVSDRLDLVPGNNSAQVIIAARPVTDVLVAQTSSTNITLLGEQLTYTFNVTNRGPNPATNLRLTDVLPGTVAFLAASTSQGGCTNAGGVITCDLAGLAAGARAQVSFLVEPTVIGTITNAVSVSSDEVDSAATNNFSTLSTVVSVPADLGVAIVDSPDPVAVSNVLTYTITITNRGPSFAANVQLTNALPSGVSFASVSPGGGVCTNDNGVVRCQLGMLPAGESTMITLMVSPTTAGRLTNSVGVRTDSIDGVASNNVAVAVTDAAFPPVILAQPQSQTVTNGGGSATSNVLFSVGVSGSAPLVYQWQFNGADLPGATSASLSLSNVVSSSAGNYRVRITNNVGQAVSAAATLVVLVAPSISDISDQQTDEDTPTPAIGFVVGDADGPAAALVVSAVSSDVLLVPINNITFGGSGSNRTVQITPAANRFGSATITVQVRDASGLTASDAFTLTVRPVNDPPTISNIPNQSTLEDVALTVGFTVDDVESSLSALAVVVVSSDTNLFPAANFSVSGTGTNRLLTLRPSTNLSGIATITVTVTDTNGASASDDFLVSVAAVNDVPTLGALGNLSILEDAGIQTVPLSGIGSGASNEIQTLAVTAASSDASIIPDPLIAYTSPETNGVLTFVPQPNASGVVTITVTVNDGGTSNNVVSRSFTVTVNAVNDLPRIRDLADLSTAEDTPVGPVGFRVDDVETAASAISLGATSSDTNLVASILLGGSGTNRTLAFTPATNRFGSTTITITATDGDGGSTSSAFVVTVVPVNDPPTIAPVAGQTTNEDTPLAVNVTVGDVETPAAQVSLLATSSNTNLIRDNDIVVSGSGSNRVVTLIPVTNGFGTATINLVATDADGGTAARSFLVTVFPMNDLPELSGIVDQTIDENTATAALALSVSDVETRVEDLVVTSSSSNPVLAPPGAVVLSGTGTNRTVTVTPATNEFGVAVITLTVMDTDGGVRSRGFQLTVRQTVFPPTITAQPQPLTVTNGATATFGVTVDGTVPIVFRWKRNGTDLPGQTNATLVLTNVQRADAGSYSVVASNAAGPQASAPAALRVLISPTITSITRSASTAQISFTSEAGLSYTVEFKDAVDAPAWGALAPVPGTGGLLTVTDAAATVESRIYRVRVE